MSARARVRLHALRAAGRFLAGKHGAEPSVVARGEPDAASPAPPPRILVIRPDHLGDLILAGPSGRLLHAILPDATVDWLVGPWGVEAARRSGARHAVLTCEFPGFTRRPKGAAWDPYTLLAREARALRERRYDGALILRPDHWWGAMLAAAAGIPRRLGFSTPETTPFLTSALPAPTARHAVEANLALAWRAAALFGVMAAAADTPSPRFEITAEDRAWAAALIEEHGVKDDGVKEHAVGEHSVDGRAVGGRAVGEHATGNTAAPLLALHPGSGAAVKNWLPARWAAVLATLSAATGARVVLSGSEAEGRLVEQIAAALAPRPLVLVGQTDLGQLAALFERCDLVLGGDSGPLHLAAAVGTPTVRLYGPTPTSMFGPWGEPARQRPVQAALPCQPCGSFAPPCGATDTPACLRVLDVETVADAALAILAAGAASRASGLSRQRSRC